MCYSMTTTPPSQLDFQDQRPFLPEVTNMVNPHLITIFKAQNTVAFWTIFMQVYYYMWINFEKDT